MAVSLLLIVGNTFAQEMTISGKVTDAEDGTELPGVSILIKGTDRGTITDFEGNYSINTDGSAVLVFNYLGYQAQEVPVNGRTSINITMEAEVEVLEEVVVIGYGVVEKGDVTGVVAKVDEEQFNKGVIASPDQLIAGKVAGVSVINNSGEPGGQANVRIRGVTSINANQQPLYVIDGVPIDNTAFNPGGFSSGRNPLSFLNPAEIEDITVLKDASAAAIYGSRGANGVIIVTTKGGSARTGKADSKPTIVYDGNTGVSFFNQDLPVLTPDEFRAAIQAFEPDRAEDTLVLGSASTNWFDEVTQTASNQQHNLSISKNIQDGNYRFNAGYQQINGVLKGSRNERYNINFNLSKGMFDNKLILRFSTKNGITRDKFASNQVGNALGFNPTQPIYSNDPVYGAFGGFFEYTDPLAPRNPVAESSSQKQEGNGFRSINNFEITYKLPWVSGLSVKSNVSYDQRFDNRTAFSPSFLKSQERTKGFYRLEDQDRNSFLYEGYLNYDRDIESVDGTLSLMGGYSFQSFNSRNTFFNHDSLTTDAFGLIAPAPRAGSIINIRSIQNENRLISFFGRANFDWKDKYLVTATLRRDGSTRFGPENRWGLFPSFAAAWRISNEQFFQGATGILNYLKLRVGYGVIGQEQIGDYLYIESYGYSQPTAFYQFGNSFVPTLRPTGVDPNIKWESTQTINVGIDYELFKGKLAGSIEVYQKNSDDLLFTVNFPAGVNTSDRILTNIGEMRNRGVEFQISAPVIRTDDYSWNLSFNAAYNQNEMVRLDNSVSSDVAPTFEWGGIAGDVGQNIQILEVGEAFESFYVFEQLYDDAGNPIFDAIEQTNMYKDQNGDGIINENDLRVLEQAAPDWILGLTSLFNWRDVDFSFTWRAHLGNYVYNNLSSNYGELRRLETAVPQNIHLSALETQFQQKQLKSDYYIENASFLKLDNITLGYTFSDLEWMRARAYITAQNLIVISGYSGFDPEFSNGIDNNPYPRSRTIVGGLTLTF